MMDEFRVDSANSLKYIDCAAFHIPPWWFKPKVCKNWRKMVITFRIRQVLGDDDHSSQLFSMETHRFITSPLSIIWELQVEWKDVYYAQRWLRIKGEREWENKRREETIEGDGDELWLLDYSILFYQSWICPRTDHRHNVYGKDTTHDVMACNGAWTWASCEPVRKSTHYKYAVLHGMTRFPYSDKISIRGKWWRARASFKGDRKSEIQYVTNLKIGNYGVARRPFVYTITRVPSTQYRKDSLEWDVIHVPGERKDLPGCS